MYMRQALATMREEKLFSGIYIAGTAMALAFTMVMAVVYYIKLAPIYPEPNRARTVYFDGMQVIAESGGRGQMSFSAKAFEEWFQASPNVEYCSPTLLAAGTGEVSERAHKFVLRQKDDYVEAVVNLVAADFFHIYDYDFLCGRPLTPQEVEAHEQVCVISDAFAEQLFGKAAIERGENQASLTSSEREQTRPEVKEVDALGKLVTLNHGWALRVVGVVRRASQLTPDSYADLLVPYTLWEVRNSRSPYTGFFSIVATVKDSEQLQALKLEMDELAARMTSSQEEYLGGTFNFGEGVETHVELTRNLETHPMHALRSENRHFLEDISDWQIIRHYAGLLFVLLFVPALNLCGIVAGRMERRSAEMAVRKTFGARRSTLLWQVVHENLVMTCIGGIIGLVLAWLAVYAFRLEILGMFFDHSTLGSAPIVSGEMLFAPMLFVGAFAAILVLNLLAAVVPAWLSLRKPIVESMMEKQ